MQDDYLYLDSIIEGEIISVFDNGRFAQVKQSYGDKILPRVLLIYPYGFMSNVLPGKNSRVLLFKCAGSDETVIGIPFDISLQPRIQQAESTLYNPTKPESYVKCDQEGDIIISGKQEVDINSQMVNIDATITNVVNAVNLGDATQFVATVGAPVQVNLLTGMGTITGTIQFKVKA